MAVLCEILLTLLPSLPPPPPPPPPPQLPPLNLQTPPFSSLTAFKEAYICKLTEFVQWSSCFFSKDSLDYEDFSHNQIVPAAYTLSPRCF